MNYTQIHSRAMLVSLSVSYWQGKKFDRKVTEAANKLHGASPDAGRYTKNLLGGERPEMKAVVKAAGALRTWHYENTLPWDREGEQLLPSANFLAYTEGLRERREAFERAARDFTNAWPEIMAEAARKLNGMFNQYEYPSQRELERRFRVNVEFSPVPAAGDFRITLPADELLRVEDAVTKRVAAASEAAMRSAWDRLYGEVERLHSALRKSMEPTASGATYTLNKVLLNSTHELLDVLERLNVTGDQGLEEMRQEVKQSLASLNLKDLNADELARINAAEKAKEIMSKMQDLYGGPAQEAE